MGLNIKLVAKAVDAFQAIGEPTRIRILETIAKTGASSVGDIAKAVSTKLINVSHHLGVLKAAGIVESEKRGRQIYYSVTTAWVSNITIKADGIAVTVLI